MDAIHIDSPTSITIRGKAIPGAEDRQEKIPGFDQEVFSRSKVLCIGAGGLISHIAPALVRKGIGALIICDDDIVEVSNLNRQRFYERDIGKNKAITLVQNLRDECVCETVLTGYALRFEEALQIGIDVSCHAVVCGVDNNPARIAASRYFRKQETPVVFIGVSIDANQGYVFVQERAGSCFGCIFPDAVNDASFPCPETPAIIDILQAIGGFAVYAIDSCLMNRPRSWNYRGLCLPDGQWDSTKRINRRSGCIEPH